MVEPPKPPPAHPQRFSQKNETKDELLRSMAAAALPSVADDRTVARGAGLHSLAEIADNRSLFIKAMPDPEKRRIAFNVVERNCRDRFAQGEEGLKLFFELMAYLRVAKVDEAVTEFENRFLPMLDQEWLKKKLNDSQ
jgi:hypothetical protein